MTPVETTDPQNQTWHPVSEGVEITTLRLEPGEKRVLIKIAAGQTFPPHAHVTPDEVFVVAGTYCDPSVEDGRPFGAGSYLRYPLGTTHRAGSPANSEGCTILVWNAGR